METPLLSVCLITYNQDKFIRQAIESILMQQVTFKWELVIADDCSTDTTRTIIEEYKVKHPDFIRLILQPKNVGPAKNWLDLLKAPKSKYIAYLEGDDYWTDPMKLQKQVDFLEADSGYVMCFHQISILKPDGEIVDDFITKVPEDYESIVSLARHNNYIHSPTVVFRNVLTEFPFELEMAPIGDYFLYMVLAEHGKIGYLKEKMAVYRYDVGVTSEWSLLKRIQTSTKLYSYMISYLHDQELKTLLIEKQVKDLTLYYNLIRNEYKHHFVSDHFFFRGLKYLMENYKNPLQILGKIKNRTIK